MVKLSRVELNVLLVGVLLMLWFSKVVGARFSQVKVVVPIAMLFQKGQRQRPQIQLLQILSLFAINLHLCCLILDLLIPICLHTSLLGLTYHVIVYLCLYMFLPW